MVCVVKSIVSQTHPQAECIGYKTTRYCTVGVKVCLIENNSIVFSIDFNNKDQCLVLNNPKMSYAYLKQYH